ncbi:MAG: DUF4855 domain-containing protein [Clostridia bacterium]|nr:DUF4855 domain-containing protein [Clostridia bacterium]
MKKLLLFLIAALMLLTACTSTAPDKNENSNENSSIPPESEWNYRTLVSFGKPYTSTYPANANYADSYGQMLTDGEKTNNLGAHYTDPCMVGYTNDNSIQIDLGENSKNVTEVVVRSLVIDTDGVKIIYKAKLYGSFDGVTFENFGVLDFINTGDQTVSEAVWVLEEPTDYRYIRVDFQKSGGAAFFFTDEIEVYANVPPAYAEDAVKQAYNEENIDRTQWKKLSTNKGAVPKFFANLALSSNYSLKNSDFDERALDEAVNANEGTKPRLTDNDRTDRSFAEPVWVGFKAQAGKTATLEFDMDTAADNVYGFKLHSISGVNVTLPAYIDVYGAKGNNDYCFIGRMYAPENKINFVYTLVLPEYINIDRVRFQFPNTESYIWLEEAEILAGYNEEPNNRLFPELNFPKVTETILWDSSEADYDTLNNVLKNKEYQAYGLFYDDTTIRGTDETAGNDTLLTDGKFAKSTYCYSGDWFFTRGSRGIEFIFDLEKLTAISSVTVSYLQQSEWGISHPKFASVHLSENGENWYKTGDYTLDESTVSVTAARKKIKFDFQTPYAARFIRVRLEGGMMFIDEIQAMGKKKVDETVTRLAESGIIAAPFYLNEDAMQFASTENTPIKAKDIPLIYSNRSLPENLLPMVAYVDEEGNIKDTFMDGFIYCHSGILPSGNPSHLENYKTDWDFLFDTYFNGQAGLDVLNTTVQTVKDALNKPDYKVQVYLTLLCTLESVTDFGDIDGDGVTENLSVSADRKKVYNWFVQKCMQEFSARGYNNLELGGFYWMNEDIHWQNDDSHIVAEAAEVIHQNGSCFIWIPYYDANRYYLGYEMGFDLVSMQPNIVFTPDAPLWRINAAVEFTKRRKMAIEIEHSYQAFGDPKFAATYLKYLYNGVLTGYNDSINIYYDDIDNLAVMGKSDSKLCRMQYDYTYQYTKGTLDVTPKALPAVEIKGNADNILNGALNNGINEYAVFSILTPPQHGYITLCEDGTFRYFPDKGYTGTDSFTYTYNLLLGESEPCTVEITIE